MLDAEPTIRQTLHRLLYFALIELRMGFREIKTTPSKISRAKFDLLIDLVHTLPLQLEQVAEGTTTYSSVMIDLKERAKQLECEAWLLDAISQSNP